jgi:hypothetical protein
VRADSEADVWTWQRHNAAHILASINLSHPEQFMAYIVVASTDSRMGKRVVVVRSLDAIATAQLRCSR